MILQSSVEVFSMDLQTNHDLKWHAVHLNKIPAKVHYDWSTPELLGALVFRSTRVCIKCFQDYKQWEHICALITHISLLPVLWSHYKNILGTLPTIILLK